MNAGRRASGDPWPGHEGRRSSEQVVAEVVVVVVESAFRVSPCVGNLLGEASIRISLQAKSEFLQSSACRVRGLARNQSEETYLCIRNRTKDNTTERNQLLPVFFFFLSEPAFSFSPPGCPFVRVALDSSAVESLRALFLPLTLVRSEEGVSGCGVVDGAVEDSAVTTVISLAVVGNEASG